MAGKTAASRALLRAAMMVDETVAWKAVNSESLWADKLGGCSVEKRVGQREAMWAGK